MAEEHAHADSFGAGLFQSFNLAEPYESGELIAFAHNGLSRGGATGHSAANYVSRDFFEISFEFRALSFES